MTGTVLLYGYSDGCCKHSMCIITALLYEYSAVSTRGLLWSSILAGRQLAAAHLAKVPLMCPLTYDAPCGGCQDGKIRNVPGKMSMGQVNTTVDGEADCLTGVPRSRNLTALKLRVRVLVLCHCIEHRLA